MRLRTLFVIIFILSQSLLFSQVSQQNHSDPAISDFSGVLSFLSSDWLEGREAGEKGSFMAADYIASMMELYKLKPAGDIETLITNTENPGKITAKRKQTFFQNFEIVRYKTGKAALAFVNHGTASENVKELLPDIDFETEPCPSGMETEAPVVFGGYGLSIPSKGYDDYKGLDVKGKIVVVMKGFPGHADTNSIAWKKLGKGLSDENNLEENKLISAFRKGSVGLIVVAADGSIKPYSHSQRNRSILKSTMNSLKDTDPEYEEYYHALPGDTSIAAIPCFRLGAAATNQLFAGTGINLTDIETKISRELVTSSSVLKGKVIRFSVELESESLCVRNVLGMIPGKDSTKNIIVGGHYDHLGIHEGFIFNGSDDNASGTSGMLALAKTWSESGAQPNCNIIFASWTAEESGLLGSSFYTQHAGPARQKTMLYINMDMISRSAPEDTARRILSVGTEKGSDKLRNLAVANNKNLSHPFVLDLWDTNDHTGSDYASFTPYKIPVMTFFSGFNDDYHTPRDIAAKADLNKMADILKLVNNCLKAFNEDIEKK